MAKRTGLRTLYATVYRLCKLNAQWGASILKVLPTEYHVYYAALTKACDDFVTAVDINEILGDETP